MMGVSQRQVGALGFRLMLGLVAPIHSKLRTTLEEERSFAF